MSYKKFLLYFFFSCICLNLFFGKILFAQYEFEKIQDSMNLVNNANSNTILKNKTIKNINSYFPQNNIYIELLGNASAFYSLNYERLLYQHNRNAISLRAGVSYVPFFGSELTSFPILFNYNYFISKGVYFDAGIGGAYFLGNQYNVIGNLGIRFLVKKHLLIRTAATFAIPTTEPFYYIALVPPISGGLSLGYSFGLPENMRPKTKISTSVRKEKIQNSDIIPLNSVFIEGLGSGYYYSLNYERAFFSTNLHALNVRIGYTCFPYRYNWNYYNALPIQITFQNRISNKTIFEAGVGTRYTFNFINKKKYQKYIEMHHKAENLNIGKFDIIGSIGVRYLIMKNFFLKIAFTPTIIYNNLDNIYNDLRPIVICQFFSVSMGYSWGKGKQGNKK